MGRNDPADLANLNRKSQRYRPGKGGRSGSVRLEELHRISIVDEKGPTAAVMEACFSFGAEAAFHLIGIYASEHNYHGRDDDAGVWAEVAKRFIPTAYREGCDRVAPWFSEKTADRLELDFAIRHQRQQRPKLSKDQARLPTPSEMDEMSGRILLEGLQELPPTSMSTPAIPASSTAERPTPPASSPPASFRTMPNIPTDEELEDQDTEKLLALLRRRQEARDKANKG